MSRKTLGGFVIYYMDGTSDGFTFLRDESEEERARSLARIESAMKGNALTLEADGHLIVVPMSSVKKLEVNPAPAMLPDTAVSVHPAGA